MERRSAHLGNSRGLSPGSPRDRGTRQRLSALHRGVLRTLVRASGDVATLGDFAPHACPRPASLSGRPLLRAGRKPRASRVRACEARPLAPHPTGLGYPAPAKLSLCPTSGSPLEAPLTGQDASRIRERATPWIGIHSQCRERLVPPRSPDAQRAASSAAWCAAEPGSRFTCCR